MAHRRIRWTSATRGAGASFATREQSLPGEDHGCDRSLRTITAVSCRYRSYVVISERADCVDRSLKRFRSPTEREGAGLIVRRSALTSSYHPVATLIVSACLALGVGCKTGEK